MVKTNKGIIVFIVGVGFLFSFQIEVMGADLKFLAESAEDVYYYDEKRVKRPSKNIMRVWIKRETNKKELEKFKKLEVLKKIEIKKKIDDLEKEIKNYEVKKKREDWLDKITEDIIFTPKKKELERLKICDKDITIDNCLKHSVAKKFYYYLTLEEIDCLEEKSRNLTIVEYDRRNNIRKTQNTSNSKWIYPIPDTIAEFILKGICSLK